MISEIQIEFLDSIDSTNIYLSNLLENNDLPNGYCIVANFQTAGRGQVGNVWESEKGQNLLFSILLKTEKIPLNEQFMLSKIVSIAIYNVLKNNGIETKIKYPNDIFYEDKKLAGILIENKIVGNKMKNSIVGIGLNVNQLEFVENKYTAISMRNITKIIYEKKIILQSLINQIVLLLNNFEINNKDWYETEYFKHLYRNSGYFSYEANNEVFEAKIISVSPNGKLKLLTNNNIEKDFCFKEVKFIL